MNRLPLYQRSAATLALFWLIAAYLLFPASVAGQEDPFQDILGGSTFSEQVPTQEPVTFKANFTIDEGGKTGKLNVTAELLPNWHIFSVTQPEGGAIRTVIVLGNSFEKARLTGVFQPDSDYHEVRAPGFDAPNQEHEGTVTWTAPIEFADGVDPGKLQIPVKIKNSQVCERNGTCLLFSPSLVAKPVARISTFAGEYKIPGLPVTVRGNLENAAAASGDTVHFDLEIEPEAGFKVTRYSHSVPTDGYATLVALTRTNGARLIEPEKSVSDSAKEGSNKYAEDKVSLRIPVALAVGMEDGVAEFRGQVGFEVVEAASSKAVGTPVVDFTFEIDVGGAPNGGTRPLLFSPPREDSLAELSGLVQKRYDEELARLGEFAGYPVAAVLGLAFLAGLILNVMPCVLPVIGIKILSFVQQAGQNPRRVLMLNLVFSLGIISVFMLLATLASFPQVLGLKEKLGWGGLFENQSFVITMVGVIFAFGLSFVGVWEVPIPGFVASAGTGKASKNEGYAGAFLKGVLTTLLATPCSGPLLIPAVTWASAQPPALTFLVFLALGVGLAFPFIVIGFRPGLVKWLPKPGEWMETFKQWMGFVLLGGAIFFFGAVKQKYQVPVLTLMLFIAVTCWLYGRISFIDTAAVRLKKKVVALVIFAAGIWFSFFVLIPQNELQWQPFSLAARDDFVDKGAVVFVDFTADW
jgi:suppressor for copper-sensitivity B